MRDPIGKKAAELKPSGIRKFFDIVAEMDDVISLGVGEPDFDTPWAIRDEGIYSLERGRTFYTSNSGLKELRTEIAAYIRRRLGVNYNPVSEILVTVGGSEGIDLAFRAMINPGDEVLIPEPSYVSYKPCAILADAVPVVIPLKEKNQFRLTAEEVEAAVTPKTKILVLPFPNNPTGAVMTRADLEAVAKIQIPGMKERTILINGFSKAYAMTGWRLGYCCGPEEIIHQMTKVHQFAIMCAPTNSQYAAVAALRDCYGEVVKMREAYNQRRRFLLHEFEKMQLPCFEPFGAFYMFPSIQEFGMSSDEFATELLKDQKVAVVPGSAFGDSGEGYVRISYAYSLDSLKVAMERLSAFITKLRQR